MIRANSMITINTAKISQLMGAAVTALEKTAEALHTEVVQAQVVPFDTGNLQNESMFVDYSEVSKGIATIVHSTTYARRLYYHPEYNFRTHENPNAKGEWFEDWLPGGKEEKFAVKTFKKLYKQEGGL